MIDEPFKRLLCLGCGFSYDEALGLPEHGLAPGTRWKDIPEDWVCRTASLISGSVCCGFSSATWTPRKVFAELLDQANAHGCD
jgi:rubredoxin